MMSDLLCRYKAPTVTNGRMLVAACAGYVAARSRGMRLPVRNREAPHKPMRVQGALSPHCGATDTPQK